MNEQIEKVASITRASWSRAMSADQWIGFLSSHHFQSRGIEGYSSNSFSDAVCDILIRLITATSPPSNRLLSYYQAALHSGPDWASLDDQLGPWISASQVSTRILIWISEMDLNQDESLQSSHSVFNRVTRLETLNLLAKPLLKFSPSIVTYEPAECLRYLSCLLDLFECCRPTSQSTRAERKLNVPAHQLADCLLASLSSCILSISRRDFLQHPDLLSPLLTKLSSRLSILDQ
ncbi:uncharacterized protein MELLADRAFT_70904, partial [Melampsora larici-populina 98AG31]